MQPHTAGSALPWRSLEEGEGLRADTGAVPGIIYVQSVLH